MLTQVPLEGLARGEVAELVEALGAAPSEAFVDTLHDETEGNPFFVEEVLRHGGDLEDAGVPEGVREVTARRIARLPESAREAMQVACVLGREFDFGLLEALGPLSGDALVGALDEAVEARVLREVDGRVGRYAFAHALVRATLYDGLSSLRRARLHSRVGETILARHRDDLDPWLPQLAFHFGRAAAVEGPQRAIDFALAAGRRADRLLAWEEAAEYYRGALRARQATSEARDRTGGELLLALGASEERAGLEGARESFAQALAVAKELEDPVLLARAALGVAGPWSTLGREDPEIVAVLEEALAGLGEEDSPLRARLLGRLSLELYYAGQPERRLALSEEAVAIARRIGDPVTLASALDARHYVLWRPENVEERLEVAAELRRIAAEVGDLELELEGAGWTVVDLLELGDVDGADVQIEAAATLASVVQRPLYLWWTSLFRCTRAQLAGEFDEAERLANETLAIGQREHAENALHYYAMAMFNIRREQGRLGEVEEAVARFIEMYPAIPAWRCTQALLHVELGRLDEARETLEAVGSRRAPARRQLADRGHPAVGGVRRARRRGAGARAARAARAPRRAQRDRGAGGELQRLRLPAARDAGERAGRVGRGRAALLRGARDARADGRAAVPGADRAGVGGDAAGARRAGRRRRGPRAPRRGDRDRRRARDGRAGGAGPRARGGGRRRPGPGLDSDGAPRCKPFRLRRLRPLLGQVDGPVPGLRGVEHPQ